MYVTPYGKSIKKIMKLFIYIKRRRCQMRYLLGSSEDQRVDYSPLSGPQISTPFTMVLPSKQQRQSHLL